MAKSNSYSVKINKTIFWIVAILIFIVVLGVSSLLLHYFAYLRLAHSSFANYYAFRGCTELLTKTATDATCRLADGSTIKLVLFHNRWYLDGDLPACLGKLCF